MRVKAPLLAVLAAAAVSLPAAVADPPKPAPAAEVTAAPVIEGAKSDPYLVELKVRNVPTGTAIIWDAFPVDPAVSRSTVRKRIVKTEQACLIAGPKGEYEIVVRLVKGDDVTELTDKVTITAGMPPVPPTPPTPPTPSDPLAAKAADLFKADPSPTKAADAAKLATVYRELVRSAVRDTGVTTSGKMLAVAADAAKQVVPLPALKGVREAFADELDAKLGKAPTAPLTTESRDLIEQQFTRIATILEGLK